MRITKEYTTIEERDKDLIFMKKSGFRCIHIWGNTDNLPISAVYVKDED